MGPMNHAAPVIPFILAGKGDCIACMEGAYSGCEVNIMGDKYRVAGLQGHNEPLVPGICVVIRKEFRYGTRFRYQKITGTVPIRIFNNS